MSASTGSYWQREALWRDHWHAGSLPARVDFAVIGGGFAGLMTAIRLRELHPGAEIVVLEAERVGYGASGRNAGFLSPLAAPVWLLGAERDPDQAWAAARINAGVHDIARWIAANVPDAELRAADLKLEARGTLSKSGLWEFKEALDDIGLAHEIGMRGGWSAGGTGTRTPPSFVVITMDAYTLHPYKLVHGLAQHAARAGIRIRERARVRTVEATLDGARVRLEDGAELAARKVIICTNAYSSSLDLGERLRAVVVHSFMVASAPLDRPVLSRDRDFTVEVAGAYHRMHGNRLIYGGSDQLLAPKGHDFEVPASVRAAFDKQLRASFPHGARITASEAWAGKFHATANGLPIIRPSRTNPAIILNVGYGGTGVALTLVCARLAAAVASDRQFASTDDERLLSVIQRTRISVRDSLRTIGRLIRRVAQPAG